MKSPRPFTEIEAIQALQRVAERWPKGLMLVHHGDEGGDLKVKRIDPTTDDVAALPSLATIKIRTEACA